MSKKPENTKKPSFHTMPWAGTGLIFFTHFVVDSQANFFAPLVPLLKEKLGLSISTIGLLISCQAISGSITQPITGVLIDRWPWLPWLAVGLIGSSVAFTAIGWVTSVYGLAAALILGGILFGLCHPDMAARAGRLSSEHAGFIVSLFVTGGRLGFAIGPLIAIFIAETMGMEHLWVFIIVALVAMAGVKLGMPAPPQRKKKDEKGPEPEGLITALRHVRGPILLLFGIAVVRGTTLANLGGFLPTIFVEKGLGLWQGGIANSVIFFSGAIGVMLGGIMGDRHGKPKVITIGVGCALVGMLAFQFSPLEWSYISLAIIGAGVFVPMGVSVALAQDYLPDHRGFASSLMLGGGWILAGLTAIPISLLGERIGMLNAFWVIPIVLMVGFVLALSLQRQAPEHDPEPIASH